MTSVSVGVAHKITTSGRYYPISYFHFLVSLTLEYLNEILLVNKPRILSVPFLPSCLPLRAVIMAGVPRGAIVLGLNHFLNGDFSTVH